MIFVHDEKEKVFYEFENIAIPLMAEYNGKMIYRIKPTEDVFIPANEKVPYEIHFFLSFFLFPMIILCRTS
ncbi:MAG: elongation factor P hydroxylase [Salibacteraceae bacterium]|jgi:elongation factor P hydroxylase